jgi:hypothetical protein
VKEDEEKKIIHFFVYRLPSFPSFSFSLQSDIKQLCWTVQIVVGNDDERETASDV